MSPKEKLISLKRHLEKVQDQAKTAVHSDEAARSAYAAWVELELRRTQKKIDYLTLSLPTDRR